VARRKSRELALRMLYQMETNGEDPEAMLIKYCTIFPYQKNVVDYTRLLLAGVKRDKEAIDGCLQGASEHWRLDRIAHVDMSILRLAVFEMLFSEDVPPKVAIDEAIELAKKYGNDESREFVNGVLDRVLRDHYREPPKQRN
jgi:N utilization substance protein B